MEGDRTDNTSSWYVPGLISQRTAAEWMRDGSLGGPTSGPTCPTAAPPPGGISTHPYLRPAKSMEERPIPYEGTAPPTRRTPPPDPEASPDAALLTRRRFPGLANQIKHARRFVERLLAPCPELTTATLLTSELATNALTHSASGAAGGKFEITVHRAPGWARVEVRDLGSAEQPRAQHSDPYDTSEHGRGLDLVEALAAKWGTEPRRDGLGRMVWFELVWDSCELTEVRAAE
ncbi:hypothetical protein GCM10009799_30590 [Nocardiopsis rhodophaea]|uniref:Histidine kinase/HSP90-like ATPase domain-containing protein n=2 Tax=Nocardiopsis rhodophaea TaxID=280238 RepID=A0ABN2T813_9ACTN